MNVKDNTQIIIAQFDRAVQKGFWKLQLRAGHPEKLLERGGVWRNHVFILSADGVSLLCLCFPCLPGPLGSQQRLDLHRSHQPATGSFSAPDSTDQSHGLECNLLLDPWSVRDCHLIILEWLGCYYLFEFMYKRDFFPKLESFCLQTVHFYFWVEEIQLSWSLVWEQLWATPDLWPHANSPASAEWSVISFQPGLFSSYKPRDSRK